MEHSFSTDSQFSETPRVNPRTARGAGRNLLFLYRGVERGERNVTLSTIEKVALALQVDAFDLLAQGKQAPTETILEINLLLSQQDKFGQQKALNILKEVFKSRSHVSDQSSGSEKSFGFSRVTCRQLAPIRPRP